MYCYEFRTLLQAQRQRLLVAMRAKTAASGEDPGIDNHLQDIEVALARIADGSYGICIDCSGEIGRARLKADPTAKRCLPCWNKVSNGEK